VTLHEIRSQRLNSELVVTVQALLAFGGEKKSASQH